MLNEYEIAADGRDVKEELMKALKEKGRVILKEGVYLTGPIEIPSGAKLILEKGAVLRFIPDFSLYMPVFTRWEGVKCWAMHPCIYINDADNVSISGEGTIDGSGQPWWDVVADRRKRNVKEPQTELERSFAALNPDYKSQPGGGGGRDYQFMRPPLIQIKNSRNVVIADVNIINSPFWTIHPLFSDGVIIRNVSIKNPYEAPNTDGIDIESSSNVKVLDSLVDVGDDGIALKSGSGEDGIKDNVPTKNVLIKNCTVRSAHGGAVIGSETAAEISDLVVEDCFFDGTETRFQGIRISCAKVFAIASFYGDSFWNNISITLRVVGITQGVGMIDECSVSIAGKAYCSRS